MPEPKELDILKADILRHASFHRERCSGADCNMSLYTLQRIAELAGIEFSREQKLLFI